MNHIEWTEDFVIGVKWIDDQHRYFVNLLQRIEQILHQTHSVEQVDRLLLELQKYAEFHFVSEENYADQLGVSGIQKHRERHQELIKEIARHTKDLRNGEYSVERYLLFLFNWLIGHTMVEDKALFGNQCLRGGCVAAPNVTLRPREDVESY